MSAATRLPTVFVAAAIKGLVPALQKLLPQTTFVDLRVNNVGSLSADDQTRVLEEAELLLAGADVLNDVIFQAKRLTWAQCTWAGVETLFKSQKPAPNATITRTGGAYALAMAEYVLAHILARERYLIESFKDQERAHWESAKYRQYRNLCDITVCVLGLGDIGREVARLCKATGMYVYGVTRSAPTADKLCEWVDSYRSLPEIADILPSCDYLCSVLPATPATTDLLSGDLLAKCRPQTTTLINLGRGSLISDESLIKAIQNGWLAGVVLDVFNEEPLPPSSPLWTLPGVTITPHTSGLAPASRVAEAFARNYRRYCAGDQLLYQVNWQKGY